jgi:adenine-specific DNA methylase
MGDGADLRLIEAGFPCHQVGAETQREQSVGLQPPVNRLHVWWARRPLTPSRAAIVASLDPATANPDTFVRQLGIERVQALVHGTPWTITGSLLERVQRRNGAEVLLLDKMVLRALEREQERRAENRNLIFELRRYSQELAANPILDGWEKDSVPLPMPWPGVGGTLPIRRVPGDPALINARIDFATSEEVKQALGAPLKWAPEDLYAYDRAFANPVAYQPTSITVLDPTSGGGSIPFEALRLGHKVIANELNPVATTILYATIDYPARFGPALKDDIEHWGMRMLQQVSQAMADVSPMSELAGEELDCLKNHLSACPELIPDFSWEHDHNGLLYVRQVTCPHCGGEAPLLNTCWLSKEAKDPWGLRVIPENGKVRFETYRVKHGRGPNGEDPNSATVNRGTGQCIHCKQAIDGDEIKRQARGESSHGKWQDRLYAVVAVRLEPKLDAKGKPRRYKTGPRAGEIITTKVRYFRVPNERDLDALLRSEQRLAKYWDEWDAQGLIPTEQFDKWSNYDRGHRMYGELRWCDMFTPRQLLGHIELIRTLKALTPGIIAEHGEPRGRAVVTYLQLAIDKGLDYNSRHTRWEYTRGVVKGTFSRHNYAVQWTFGEMIFSGPNSGAAWGLSQVLDAFNGLSDLAEPVYQGTKGQPPVRIINGTAAYLDGVTDGSVDLVCMDPPYYNNVQYAELSDFFYVWQKRTLKDLYPSLYSRRLTDKKAEAVANPARDGSGNRAAAEYERLMAEIFTEARRALRDDGLLTLMFNHKTQEAWETLTRSLIESGWTITACFPVESEGENSMHQKDLAAAASSIFLACRKRNTDDSGTAVWQGFGGQGVRHDIERAVQTGLDDFASLKLNPVDEMVASYGKALLVLSSQWPVQDGDEQVSPMMAMNEASRVVAQSRVSRITKGKVQVGDLDSETAMALTIFGIWECAEVAYDDILLLSKSLGIALVNKTSSSGSTGYKVDDREIGLNTEAGGRASKSEQVHAPLVRKGSKLRLALPEQRQPARLANPQTDWDRLHGLIMAYREGDIPVARAYLQEHAAEHSDRIIDLLEVWAAEARHPDRQREARTMLYGLGRQLS